MSGQKRHVSVALLSYKDAQGLDHVALMGAEIELEGEELERAERLNAVVTKALGTEVGGPVVEPVPPVAPADAGVLLEEKKPAARTSAADKK